MREIKFRAWDGKEMLENITPFFQDGHPILLGGGFNRNCPISKGWNVETEFWDYADFKVMQFTGLKDKNGKEIYEGDILKDGKGQYGHVLCAHNSWLIEWMVRDYEGKLTYEKMLDDCFGYGEIIGNIYENEIFLKSK